MTTRYLTQALIDCWDQANIDHHFTDYWPSNKTNSLYLVLSDGEAQAGTPFPYVVFEQTITIVVDRSSGTVDASYNRIQRTSVRFTVHTNTDTSPTGKSAKEFAADLAGVIMYVYGDTPTAPHVHGTPATGQRILDFEVGAHILTQYQNDIPARTGDEEYSWTVNYDFLYDVPIGLFEEESSASSSPSSSSLSSSSSRSNSSFSRSYSSSSSNSFSLL